MSGWGLRICYHTKFPGDTDTAGPETMLWELPQRKDYVNGEGLLVSSEDDSHILCMVSRGHSSEDSVCQSQNSAFDKHQVI